MARPKKKTDEFIDQDEPEAERDLAIPDDKIVQFAKNINAAEARKAIPQGEVGQLYKQFTEDGGHNKAMKLALKLQGMESIQAQEFLRQLDRYMRVLGIYDQHDLFDALPDFGAQDFAEASASLH